MNLPRLLKLTMVVGVPHGMRASKLLTSWLNPAGFVCWRPLTVGDSQVIFLSVTQIIFSKWESKISGRKAFVINLLYRHICFYLFFPILDSRELTYPTNGKGNLSSQPSLQGGYVYFLGGRVHVQQKLVQQLPLSPK